MKLDELPDQPRSGSDRTLSTIANVAAIMTEAGITARYNVIKKKTQILLPDHGGTADNLDNVSLTTIVSLAAQHGMPTGHVGEYVNAIADRHAYNPVADWIRSQPWDGTDRLRAFYATVTEQEGYPVVLKEALLHKWLLSAAAAALHPKYHGRGVLTLQGPQGIGKTSWVRSLVSDPDLCEAVVKLDHHLDGSNKDSVLLAISNWLVEIGELDSSFKKDVARLKGFLTADSDKVRRPYDRRESEYPRRTVFAATVNESAFLVDTTGNSRWWTISVAKLDFQHGIDMQQLFAQLEVELGDNGEWWLSPDEEAMLAALNARHTVTSVVVERVMAVIDMERQQTEAVTASQLLRIAGIDNPTNPQAKECGGLLRELLGEPSRIQGIMKWRVPLREPQLVERRRRRDRDGTSVNGDPDETF
ncbi:VapE domain-containing protein [Sphingomonas sp. 8AM]|uniref:VapE domain-containing protein n=1 Tax=Sphingomonas sp. 8AM TaxID=2653170 RepID=UPI0012F0DB42|nr:VapE domain-containing protein [Sphingomonas sp. 8AM]VXC65844.1 conserved hypothetical protein [Sphingomonas sp. 8AM]